MQFYLKIHSPLQCFNEITYHCDNITRIHLRMKYSGVTSHSRHRNRMWFHVELCHSIIHFLWKRLRNSESWTGQVRYVRKITTIHRSFGPSETKKIYSIFVRAHGRYRIELKYFILASTEKSMYHWRTFYISKKVDKQERKRT